MNIFTENSYAQILRKIVMERKPADPRCNFQSLSTAMGIQKSYLSKVLGGSAHLNADQLFLACEHLALSEEQRDYLFLLLESARSSVKRRREALQVEIRKQQTRHLDSKDYLKSTQVATSDSGMTEYFLDPFHQLIHITLMIPRYRGNFELLASDLGLPLARIHKCVNRLEVMGILTRDGKSVRVDPANAHLPKESPLYPVWRNQLRQMAFHKLQNSDPSDNYSFSVLFSADATTRTRLQTRFLELIKDAETWVSNAQARDTYQLNFDLFAWT